jgi:hypothetical protein
MSRFAWRECLILKMSRRSFIFVVCALLMLTTTQAASEAKILKVLPHLLDKQGRHTIYPSLFERDFYQAELRKNPENCSGMRFDIQWKGRHFNKRPATVRLEVRGVNTPPRKAEQFEQSVPAGGFFGKWSQLRVEGKDFARIGAIRAWRVTLWEGERQLAEQKSFLW